MLTTFKILSLPKTVTLLINGVNAITNYEYLIVKNPLITINNNRNIKGINFDHFTYSLKDQRKETWTKKIRVNISEKADTNIPASANTIVQLEKNTEYNLLDYLPINSSTDKIIIKNKSNNFILLKNNDIYHKTIILHIDLVDIKFRIDDYGGEPLMNLTYNCGNHLGNDITDYHLTINVPDKAEISLLDEEIINDTIDVDVNGMITTFPRRRIWSRIKIYNGYDNSKIVFSSELITDLFSENIHNKIVYLFSGMELMQSIGNENHEIDLYQGTNEIMLYIERINTSGTSKTLNVNINLMSMDNNPLLIGDNSQVIINKTF